MLIIKAFQLADLAHRGQLRKYTGRPYIEHPMRVASRAMLWSGVQPHVIAAAVCHDVIEDCGDVYIKLILNELGNDVLTLVKELTNPSKNFPTLPRWERKAKDREHLKTCSPWAKVIKNLDRMDNLMEMGDAPEDFKKLYAVETRKLAPYIHVTDSLTTELLQITNQLSPV